MRVLLVEDDQALAQGVQLALRDQGLAVNHVNTGAMALSSIRSGDCDAVVLDLGLPDMDGLEVLKQTRYKFPRLPVLVLTARDGVEDRVAGLNAGADDYLTKPFSREELLARLQAILRRSRLPAYGPSPAEPVPPSDETLRVDPELPRAWLGNEVIDLTQREWELLDLLVRHTGRVVSRDDVLAAWQADAGDAGGVASNALEVYVHRLRRKLADSELSIRNVRGLGYMLERAES